MFITESRSTIAGNKHVSTLAWPARFSEGLYHLQDIGVNGDLQQNL